MNRLYRGIQGLSRMIYVNAKFRNQPMAGVQRYAGEICDRLKEYVCEIQDQSYSRGIKGHMWEQFVLPRKVPRGELLWSPCTTGPLRVSYHVPTIHSLAFLEFSDGFSAVFREWYRFLIPRLARRCPRILTVSEFSKSRIVELLKVPESKVGIVYNGVNSNFHPASSDEIGEVKRKFKIDCRYFVSLGTLEPRKNLRRLFQAWPLLRKKMGDEPIKLIVIGKSENVFRQEKFENITDDIVFTGRLSDAEIRGVMSGASGMIYPALYEGFGIPPIEAMACGCPVACSNATALPEVVGTAAVLFDPLSIESIADSMVDVLDESKKQSRIDAGLRQAGKYSWDVSARQVLEELRKA
jgi:glycosyltransferase involved in cell wall biosynthesis